MRINLVYPPNVERAGTPRPPINLATMASYIRDAGHKVKIYDIDAECIVDAEKIAAYIMRDKPQIIGFSCMTPRFPISVEVAEACKRISSDVIVIVGGPHATGDPESVLYSSSIDYAIVGEGEEALLELLDKLEAGEDISSIPNLVLRIGDSVKVNPVRPFIENLDQLPFPSWDLLPLELYRDPVMFTGLYMSINSSRGCAWDCSFCASKVIWKRKVRMRSAENLVEELRILVKDYNISEFMYENILKQVGKGVTKDQIRSAVAILKKIKMPFYASYMIGHPGDTHDSIKATIDFAKELDSDQVKFTLSTPFPGTYLYDLAKEKGLISSDPKELAKFTAYQHIAVNLSNVSDEELRDYQKNAYLEYDLHKRPLIESNQEN